MLSLLFALSTRIKAWSKSSVYFSNEDIHANASECHWNALFALCYVSGVDNVAEVVQVLLDAGANVNTKVKDGSNCLIAWCQQNHDHPDFIPVLRLLIKRGIDLSCTDDQNRNALLIICELHNGPRMLDIARLLVESHIDVHLRDKSGRSAVEILEKRCSRFRNYTISQKKTM